MGSSRPRDGTHVSCTGRQILRHWTTREAQESHVEIVAQGIHEDVERTSHAALFSFPLWLGTLISTSRRDFHRDFDVTKDKFSRGGNMTLGSLLSRFMVCFLGSSGGRVGPREFLLFILSSSSLPFPVFLEEEPHSVHWVTRAVSAVLRSPSSFLRLTSLLYCWWLSN